VVTQEQGPEIPEKWVMGVCQTEEDVRSKYENWANSYDSDVSDIYGSVPREVARMLSQHASSLKQSSVLDVGAGTGLVGIALASFGFQDLIAVDISPNMLAKAEAKQVYKTTICSSIQGLRDLPNRESVAAVVAAGVFAEGQAGADELKILHELVQDRSIVVFTARQSFLCQLEGTVRDLGWTLLNRKAMPVYADPMHICAYQVNKTRDNSADTGSLGGYHGSVAALDSELSELQELEIINSKLEALNGDCCKEKLVEMGLIRESREAVYKLGADEPVPFFRLYLVKAKTGMFQPLKEVGEEHKAIIIFLPGCGTSFSVANTLIDIAGKYHGRKGKNRNAEHRQKSQEPETCEYVLPGDDTLRAAAFAMDLPLNGMGSGAPDVFFSERGLMAVIRHAHLVLAALYPGRPVFVAGRSQGGIAGILYSQTYNDVAGVIAVNPPHPDPELFGFTVEYLESKASVLAELLHAPGVSLHPPSWNAYQKYTPLFDYPTRPSLASILILVSKGDPFNKFPKYAEKLQEFAAADQNLRQLHVLDAGHNLWDRRSDTYDHVLSLQTKFILAQIAKSSV